ncbi:MAG: alpha-L-fucosidase [Caldilineaceae bacterium]
MHFQPTFESVSSHVVPDWFHDAKLGIFVHWGLYSVPGWAPLAGELSDVFESGDWATWFANNPYAEWYYNSLRIDGSATQRYQHATYGADSSYFDFVSHFNQAVAGWDPAEWAVLFRSVRAQYVVLTTKHHDGFLLWPSRHPNPFIEEYHARRDLVGELTQAVRAQGMEMGLYYSGGLDWTFNPHVIQDIADIPAGVPQTPEYVDYANAHWRELIERYQTAILWNDIAYPAGTNLNQLFADFYNTIPHGVVNNRFTQRFSLAEGNITSDNHCDFDTPEYASFAEIRDKKWESCRGVGASFGYNRQEGPDQYIQEDDLIRSFVDIVSKNGNLLLNVGPMADGTIPDLQRERLRALGDWLAVNGEGIFGSRPWARAEGAAHSDGQSVGVRYTQKDGKIYAFLMDAPSHAEIVIDDFPIRDAAQIHLLGSPDPLKFSAVEGGVLVNLPALYSGSPVHTLCID